MIRIAAMHPLGDLIEARCAQNGWSTRDVERQASDAGERINKSRVSEMAQEMPPSITRQNLFGLAAGLQVTPLTVARAALASWGVDTSGLEVTDTLATVEIDPTLTESQRAQLTALITSMRSADAVQPRRGRLMSRKKPAVGRDKKSG